MANRINELVNPKHRLTNAVTSKPVVMKRLILLRSARNPFVNFPIA
jgi:hypothetical protein